MESSTSPILLLTGSWKLRLISGDSVIELSIFLCFWNCLFTRYGMSSPFIELIALKKKYIAMLVESFI